MYFLVHPRVLSCSSSCSSFVTSCCNLAGVPPSLPCARLLSVKNRSPLFRVFGWNSWGPAQHFLQGFQPVSSWKGLCVRAGGGGGGSPLNRYWVWHTGWCRSERGQRYSVLSNQQPVVSFCSSLVVTPDQKCWYLGEQAWEGQRGAGFSFRQRASHSAHAWLPSCPIGSYRIQSLLSWRGSPQLTLQGVPSRMQPSPPPLFRRAPHPKTRVESSTPGFLKTDS